MPEETQTITVNVDPNIYAITNVSISSNEEQFIIAIFSGNQVRQFLATPKHAKRIHLLLKQQIEEYEKNFGEIITNLPSPKETQFPKPEVGFVPKK